MLVVQVLGPVRAWRDGTALALGPPSRKALFGLLALAHGKPVTRAELVDALWGERPPPTAANVIHTHVKHLRQLLEPDRGARAPSTTLPAVGDGYALTVPPDGMDVVRFRSLVARAGPVARDDPRQAAELLGQALELWHGRPLADVPALGDHPGVVTLAGEHRAALARHAEAMIAIGAARDVLPALVEHVAAQGLDEAMHALLIRTYTASGQRDKAFSTYNAVRRHLSEELGVGPGPELTAAYLDALEETPAAPAQPRSVSPGVNQLPGDVFGFTGRRRELTELGRVLGAERAGVPIVVVCGTAGVGKTALALHWAHRIRPDFPDGQLYVDLRGYDSRSPVAAEDALSRLLDGLGVTGADVPVDPDQRAARYRAELADRRVLIVLDNASAVDQVRPLLPGTPGCLVLVTSRNSLAGLVALHGAHRLDVDPLPAPDSLVLLGTLIGERVRREPAAAAELAARCGRLPLALRVAAELAASRPASTLAELTGELADRRRRLRVLDAGDDVRATVRTVFSWSYLQLRPQVAKAFRRLGLHPGAEVTPFALAALTGDDQDESRRTLDALARNHLVQPVPAGRFVVHDLLRAYAEELAHEHDPLPERSAAVDRLLVHHLATASAAMDLLYPADRPYRPRVPLTPPSAFPTADAARAWLDAERPTLVALCRFAERDDRPGYAVDLANTLYRYLEGGHYADASTIHECALRAAQRAGDDTMLAAALTNLGALHRLLGDYDQAAGNLHTAIELHRRTGDQYGAARASSNLGIVQERRGEYEEASSLHLEALTLHRRLGNRYGEAAALLNLGNAHSRPGHHADAAEYLERALELFHHLDDAIGQASALSNLGDVCASLRRYPDAVRHLGLARELFQRLDHNYGVAVTLSNLGNVHTRLGDWSQAHRCHTSALETFRDIGHRYGEASALNGLGETLRAAGRPDEARAAHAGALRIATETGDQDEQDRARAGLEAAHLNGVANCIR